MAYELPLKIAEVVQKISNNKYVLPSIQREYVWDTEQIETLFDSLMQGYPIGTFLFWEVDKDNVSEFQFYEFLRNYHEKNSVHNKKIDLRGSEGVTAILDGQQRLTSIYIGLKGSYAYKLKHKQKTNENAYPTRKLYLNLLSEAKEGNKKYDFRFLVPNEIKNDEMSYWFEVGKILDMNDISDKDDYLEDNVRYREGFNNCTKEQSKFASRTLSRLYNIINEIGTISYYREQSKELDKVLNIFVRVNSGGTKLSYSDLLLSIASAQWESHDAREEITDFVDEINAIGNGFKINKDFVLKSMLVLADLDIAFKVKNFNKENMMKIEKRWEEIKRAIRQTVCLVSSFGYCGETLSSNNALIPISFYLFTIGAPENFVDSSNFKNNRSKIKKWLISVLLKKQFSGQPDNVIRPIRDIIRKNGMSEFPIEDIIDRFKGTDKSIRFTEEDIDDYLLQLTYGKSETLSALMLLYPSLDFSNRFHMDHIYPKSKFNKEYLTTKGISIDKIDAYIKLVNDISNLQLLKATINEEKSNEDFDIWFDKENLSETDKINYRSTHYLPDMEYTYLNFVDFIEKRKELIKSKLREKLL